MPELGTNTIQRKTFRAAIALAMLAMSWHVIRLPAVNVTLSDLALAACMVALAVRGRLNRVPLGSLTFLWSLGLMLMLGGLFIGSTAHEMLDRWLIIATQYVFSFLFVPMVLMTETRDWMRRAQVWYVVGVAISQAFALTLDQFMLPADADALFGPGMLAGNGRIGALTGEANWNGAVIGMALPMLLNLASKRILSLKYVVVLAVPLAWGLLASGSFTGFSAATMGITIYLLISSPMNLVKFGVPVVVLATVYVLSGLPLPEVFNARVAGALHSGSLQQAGTFEFRKELINEAWQMSGQTIFVGLGADAYRDKSIYGAPVHNFPLLILTEGGIVGVLGLAILLLTLILLATKAIRSNRDDGAMALAVVAVFLAFTMAIPHMYTRLWLGPVMLALAPSLCRPSMLFLQHARPAQVRPLSRDGRRPRTRQLAS